MKSNLLLYQQTYQAYYPKLDQFISMHRLIVTLTTVTSHPKRSQKIRRIHFMEILAVKINLFNRSRYSISMITISLILPKFYFLNLRILLYLSNNIGTILDNFMLSADKPVMSKPYLTSGFLYNICIIN